MAQNQILKTNKFSTSKLNENDGPLHMSFSTDAGKYKIVSQIY